MLFYITDARNGTLLSKSSFCRDRWFQWKIPNGCSPRNSRLMMSEARKYAHTAGISQRCLQKMQFLLSILKISLRPACCVDTFDIPALGSIRDAEHWTYNSSEYPVAEKLEFKVRSLLLFRYSAGILTGYFVTSEKLPRRPARSPLYPRILRHQTPVNHRQFSKALHDRAMNPRPICG